MSIPGLKNWIPGPKPTPPEPMHEIKLSELPKCTDCRGHSLFFEMETAHEITCSKCGFSGGNCSTDEEAVKAWIEKAQSWSNEPERLRAENARLKEELAQANEYARKLSLKVTDLCKERDGAKERAEQYRAALGRILDEVPRADGLTWFYPVFDEYGNQVGRRPANLSQAISGIYHTAAHVLNKCKGGRDYRDGGLKGEALALEGGKV